MLNLDSLARSCGFWGRGEKASQGLLLVLDSFNIKLEHLYPRIMVNTQRIVWSHPLRGLLIQGYGVSREEKQQKAAGCSYFQSKQRV